MVHPRSRVAPAPASAAVPALLALAGTLATLAGQAAAGDELPPVARALSFVENLGQWDSPASFVAMSGPTVLRVLDDGFVVDVELGAGAVRPDGPARAHLGFALEGARPDLAPRGEGLLPGRRDWLVGAREDWVLGARAWAEVLWPDVAEGVDLRLRDGGGLPEYDLLLAPGADLASVVLRCDGARGLAVDEDGALLLDTPTGVLRQSPPTTWAVLPDGGTRPLECAFVVLDEARYGFRLADHDPALPVVVDPGLEWASYVMGGSRDWMWELDVGPSNELAMCGETLSSDLPVTDGSTYHAPRMAWVAIADPSWSSLLYCAYIGGSQSAGEGGMDVKVGPDGRVYLAGHTGSPDFPTLPGAGALHPSDLPGWDGFLMEFTPELGTYALTYSTYIGGDGYDGVGSLVVDGPRTVVLAGVTSSLDLATTAGALQPAFGGGKCDYFLQRMVLGDVTTPTLVTHATYLGGSAQDGWTTNFGNSTQRMKDPRLHRSADGTLTLGGRTFSTDIVRSASPWQHKINLTGTPGAEDGYVAVVDSTLSTVLWDSYLGGTDDDGGRSVVREPSGIVTIGGFTDSADFPTTPGAFDTSFAGVLPAHDGFVLRLDPSLPPAQQRLYGTFLGGDGYENVLGLDVDSQGRILAAGYTGPNSAELFPTTSCAWQPAQMGLSDRFLVYLDPAGQGPKDLLYGTHLGGPTHESPGFALRLLDEGSTVRVLMAGQSGQGGHPFPDTWGWQPGPPSPTSLENGYALKFSFDGALEIPRAGTPPNPMALLPGVTSGPLIGQTWDPVVDHTSGFLPGALVDLLYVTGGPLNLDLPPHGTLLLNPLTLILGKATPAGVPFALPIPWDHAFCGLELHTQAASGDGVQVLLTNALDVRIGAF